MGKKFFLLLLLFLIPSFLLPAQGKTITIETEPEDCQVKVYKWVSFENPKGELLIEGNSPLEIPEEKLKGIRGIVIEVSKEGYKTYQLNSLAPFEDFYHIQLKRLEGTIREKTKGETEKFEESKPKTITPGEFKIEEVEKLISEAIPIPFPDGIVGRRYNFLFSSPSLSTPYKFFLLEGNLPPGLYFNGKTGGIEGIPKEVGKWGFVLSIVDSKGKKVSYKGLIQIYRILTVGENGTFKGFDGIQMTINRAQDLEEIRIQSGIYKGTGLIIPENKIWEHGIKISGGWDEEFLNRKGETILDGEGKEERILIIANKKGKVYIENIKFRNSKGGAVYTKGGELIFTNCVFTNNSANYSGGAVYGGSAFVNCTFTNNSAYDGGAVYGGSTFVNCTFTNNSADYRGGAVSKGTTFICCNFYKNSAFYKNSLSEGGEGGASWEGEVFYNCLFHENSAYLGGAIYHGDIRDGEFVIDVINCDFYNNKAEKEGGAILCKEIGGAKIINSVFYKNTAGGESNDIKSESNLEIDYCLINHLKGPANFGPHNITGDPKFVNPEKGNFKLKFDSPCIDKGINKILEEIKESVMLGKSEKIKKMIELLFSLDVFGNPRVKGKNVDIGASEYQGEII